ncbi:conserved hypothetical protein [Ruegeria lacuscaerulensis ITI-1157]|nr:conserved hypothetical protein [Ruegeria lacuscaerulensis ITI-1157]SHI56942.1 hypothetical protein SAMN05444404_0543 [Ruegeria lacuscaerulensis ITI-1157]
MLWLHLGMPKTGTTALQSFLRNNAAVLSDAGLRYMEAGRQRPNSGERPKVSHNIMAFHMNQSSQPMDDFREAMGREYEEHGEKACLVSSEMFYNADLVRLAQVFSEIPVREIRIVFYCRRYSDFFEADYKQRAKNGRLPADGSGFVRDRLAAIRANPDGHSYAGAVSRIRAAFPGVAIVPLLYERAELTNGNVIDDFLSRLGVAPPPGCSTDLPANPSLSRVASEAFGVVTRAIGRKRSRQLRRQAVSDPVMIRRHDVLEPDERAWLDDFLAEADEGFRQEFFPDRKVLFSPVRLGAEDQRFRRDSAEEVAALKQAAEIVFRMALDV